MTAYAVAQLTTTDRAAHRRYQARFPTILARFDGTLLPAGDHARARIVDPV